MSLEAIPVLTGDRCRRHEASGTQPGEHWQSYWMRTPESPVGDDCEYFWPQQATINEGASR